MSWPIVPLEECTRIVGGATPSTSVPEFWDGDILWATPKDLSDLEGTHLDVTARKITDRGLASCAAEVLPAGSVLFSSRAPIGQVAINRVPVATNQGFKSFIPDGRRLEAGYLFWWLKTNRTRLENLGNGATFKELSKAAVARIEIPLPSLPEQRRIAAILDQADELRLMRVRAISRLNDIGQAIFAEMFGADAKSIGASKQPLGGFLKFITSGGRGWAEYYSPSGARFIRSLNVQMNHISDEDVVFVRAPNNAEAQRTRGEKW